MNLCICAPNKFRYSETFIHNQIQALEPSVLLYEGWYPSIQPNGKSFLPFPLSWLPVRGALRRYLPKVYHRLFTHLFAKYLRNHQIDTLLANYGPMGATLAEACSIAKCRLIVHFHGFDAYHYPTIQEFGERYQAMFAKAYRIVAVSRDMQAQLIHLGAPAEKVVCNPYGVELSQFGGVAPEKQPPVFTFVGRFTAKKAPDLTIKAFAEVLKVVPEARLVTVGEGERWEEAKALVQQIGIGNNVEFLGVKTPSEVAQILQKSRAFVQHSLRPTNGDSEGTPNTVLEASATGLPIVSTYHAGIKDAVVHEKTGFLVEEGDWQQMANYMIMLAQQPILAQQMGQAARRHMEENYEMSQRIQALKTILN
ncbi:MAG: glycosyltransferase [Spirosomataceae bacterium]